MKRMPMARRCACPSPEAWPVNAHFCGGCGRPLHPDVFDGALDGPEPAYAVSSPFQIPGQDFEPRSFADERRSGLMFGAMLVLCVVAWCVVGAWVTHAFGGDAMALCQERHSFETCAHTLF